MDVNKIKSFLKSDPIQKYIEEKQNLIKDYNLDGLYHFNFFESVSEQYKKENLHSDILAVILDPNTPDIGNRKFLDCFFDFIDDKNNELKECFSQSKKTYIEREKGRIDILIHDTHNAIIIENKINGAIDQKNQIPRYIEKVKNKNMEVKKVVYLTLNGEKEPPKEFTEKYKKYGIEVAEKTISIEAVNKEKKDLVHDFLEKCIRTINKNYVSKIFLQQYQGLLKHLGGEILMDKYNSQLIRKCLTKNYISSLYELIDFFNGQKSFIATLGQAIIEDLKKRKEFKFEENSKAVGITHKLNDDIALIFWNVGGDMGYGFYSESKKIKGHAKDKIKNIMKNSDLDSYSNDFWETTGGYCDSEWGVRSIDFEKIKLGKIIYKELLDNIIKKFDSIKKKFEES